MAMLALVALSCDGGDISKDKPIVTVGETTLLESRLMAALPPNVSSADSAIIAEEFIKRWIQQQVMLQKAQLNLTDEDQDIAAAVEEYRVSLIVERYQQKMVASKFEPVITDSAMTQYYESMKHNFKLHDNIIKGVYAVIPNSVREKNKIKKLISSPNAGNAMDLEQYLFKYAVKYEISMDKWMPMSYIRSSMPSAMMKNEISMLKSKKFAEYKDEENTYYLMVTDNLMVDEISPLEFVKEQIYTILLNKEKIKFIKKMQSELLNEAQGRNTIKYHYKTN